jgi:hypothetical protein
MEFIIVLVILTIVAIVVTQPLRRASEEPATEHTNGSRPAARRDAAATDVAALEAAREAKYREIRDAELDHRTGKLSDADYEEVDRSLRAEAVAILHALDQARTKATDA